MLFISETPEITARQVEEKRDGTVVAKDEVVKAEAGVGGGGSSDVFLCMHIFINCDTVSSGFAKADPLKQLF